MRSRAKLDAAQAEQVFAKHGLRPLTTITAVRPPSPRPTGFRRSPSAAISTSP